MKYETTARRIKEAMSDMGISQQELADLSKIGKSSISHYVNGSNEPGNKSAYMMAQVLNVNPAWLMGLDVPKDSIVNLELNLIRKRLDSLDIDNNDEQALERNNQEYWKLNEDYHTIKKLMENNEVNKALEIYELYKNANKNVQDAIDSLLGVSKSES